MPSIYDLKPAFQRLLQPLLQLSSRLGVSPNQVTISGCLLSGVGGLLLWWAPQHPAYLLAIPLILLVRMALNALDGMLARTYGKSTPLGEILNEVGDIVSDTLLYLPLIVLMPSSNMAVLQVCLFVLLGLLSEFCGVLAKSMIGIRRYDGPMGKSDRAFVVALFCLAFYFWPTTVASAGAWIFLGFNGLLILSCVNRLRPILSATGQTVGEKCER